MNTEHKHVDCDSNNEYLLTLYFTTDGDGTPYIHGVQLIDATLYDCTSSGFDVPHDDNWPGYCREKNGHLLEALRDDDEAIESCRKSLEVGPNELADAYESTRSNE